jgi:hypothetical protein
MPFYFQFMKFLFFGFALFVTIHVYGQEKSALEKFKSDFSKALNDSFTESDLNAMFRQYSDLLTPGSDVTQLSQSLQGKKMAFYPLADFRDEKLYTDNIDRLLFSKNTNQKILSYLVIAASGDTSKENTLLSRINSKQEKGKLLWAGMALLYFNCNHTTPLFDFLVENEDFGDAHMIPMYIHLNKDSLRETAYNRIHSDNIKAKVLAAQVLSVTGLNAKTESLLMEAVKTWGMNLKGYAIYSVKELQIGNLLETLKPLLDSPQTRSISLNALANSPTEQDRNYIFGLIQKQDTVSEDLLNSLFESKNTANLRYWLKLLSTKPTPKDYLILFFSNPLISSDEMLPDVQDALLNIKTPKLISDLIRVLEYRTDETSIELMISFLKNPDSSVRYWTAKSLEHNQSARLKDPEIQALLKKGLDDGNN